MIRVIIIVLLLATIAMVSLVFRYEEKVYGGKMYIYDRFTNTVYLTSASAKKSVLRKTRFTNLDDAMQYERRRELQNIEETQQRADALERKQQDMEDEMQEKQSELVRQQQDMEYEMQRKQSELEQQQRDMERKQRNMERKQSNMEWEIIRNR